MHVHVAKPHARHAKWWSMTPSATPATQRAAASTASTENQARHQSQPSAAGGGDGSAQPKTRTPHKDVGKNDPSKAWRETWSLSHWDLLSPFESNFNQIHDERLKRRADVENLTPLWTQGRTTCYFRSHNGRCHCRCGEYPGATLATLHIILPFKFIPWLRANIAFRTLFFLTPFWARGCKGGSECMRFA